MLGTGKEEMNHMFAGDKSVLALSSEQDGPHGTVDGGPEGKADIDLPLHGHCSWNLFFGYICSHDYRCTHNIRVCNNTSTRKESLWMLKGRCDSSRGWIWDDLLVLWHLG